MNSGAGLADPALRMGTQPGAVSTELRVEPEKLTRVADVIEQQADSLERTVRDELEALQIAEPAFDLTSRTAVRGWNALLTAGTDSYSDRVLRYVVELRQLVERLRAAAIQYGTTERATAADLGRIAPGDR